MRRDQAAFEAVRRIVRVLPIALAVLGAVFGFAGCGWDRDPNAEAKKVAGLARKAFPDRTWAAYCRAMSPESDHAYDCDLYFEQPSDASIASTYAFVLHAEDTIDAGSDSDTRVIVWPAHHERTNVLRESLIRCPDSPYFSDAWYFADWAPQSGRALAKKLDRRHCRIVKWDDAKLRDGEPVFRGHALIDLDRGDV